MKKLCYYLAIIILLTSSAFKCSSEQDEDLMTCCGPPPCTEKTTISGTWRLTAFQNVSTGVLDPDPQPDGKGVVFTLSDDQTTGKLEGHTFVNTVFGTYTLKSGCEIKFETFGASKVGEPGWSSKAWLNSGDGSFSVTPEKLVISLDNASERLIFSKLK